ncbi:hypothetical protein GW17_00050689, partial [Ensete ventricosum]
YKLLKLLVQAVIAEEKPSAGTSQCSGEEQAANNWKGFCSLSSYTPYFNVDTEVVVDRIISSVYPMDDFSRKIDGSPDLYGPVWISATLVFMLAALGNYGTYLIQKRSEQNGDWEFDVSYVDWAACVVFGYAVAVPAAFYFLLQYFGLNANLVRLWCMWGYSLFVFVPASVTLTSADLGLCWNYVLVVVGGAFRDLQVDHHYTCWFRVILVRVSKPEGFHRGK